MKFYRGILILLLTLFAISCSNELSPAPAATTPPSSSSTPIYKYEVVNTYPHDRNSFTEGLVFDSGTLYEGTGLYGRSSLRRVDLTTGKILQIYNLPDNYFGEGITILKNTLIQLTWQSHIGFVYDKASFNSLRQFTYQTEGWGITCDGNRLIMSDGTSFLHFLDPQTFMSTGSLEVEDNKIPVNNINELEYIKGKVYANIWQTDRIAIIDPVTGSVTGWIDLTGLLPTQYRSTSVDVLNGIAYDTPSDRLFVTGKLWPLLFEIKLVNKING